MGNACAGEKVEARSGAAIIGSDFINALTAHKYEAAHALLIAAQQWALSVGAIRNFEEQVEKKYGKPPHRAAIDECAIDKNLKSARLLYDKTYQDNKDLFLVSLVCIDGKWQVAKHQYDYNPV